MALIAAVAPVYAQHTLVAHWTPESRWVQGVPDRRESSDSDAGVIRGRVPGSGCRSTLTESDDAPIVVRFDSTETTLVGRATNVVNAVAAFRGSAWDVSDPTAPRRLNMILREPPAAVLDTAWTFAAREPLHVMASDYDGTGTTYAGLNPTLLPSDCLYTLALEPSDGTPFGPVTLDVRPAYVNNLFARRGGTRANMSWTYDEPEGTSFQIRRLAEGAGVGPIVGTVPLSARSYLDEGVPPDSLFRYRVEVVDAEGRIVHSSAISALPIPSGSAGLTVLGRANTSVGGAGDVWGYVGPDGREYALVNGLGLNIFDVTDPAAPVQIAYVPGGNSDVEAYSHYAYITGDSEPVQVVDLSDPAAPVLVGEFWGHPDAPGVGVHTLSIAGGRLYLNGNVGGLSIWSLADPAAPVYVGAYRPEYIHDVLVRGDTMYAAKIQGDGFDVVDVTDPTAPALMASVAYPGTGAHNVCSTTDGRYIFVGDEVGTGRWTRVFDVSDLQNIEMVAEIIVDSEITVHNCHVVGDLLFLAHYNRGIRVWNVADPTVPYEVAYHDFEGVGRWGIWTVWPHLPSGNLLATDIENGLLVLQLDKGVSAEPPPPSASAALALAPNPTADATTAFVTLAAPSAVALAIYDVLGRRVARVSAGLAAGPHRLSVPTAALPAGVYVIRLVIDGRPAGAQTLTVAR